MNKHVRIKIDGESLDARFLIGLGREAGIKQLVKDGIAHGSTTDEKAKWAARTWDKLEEELKKLDAPKEEVKATTEVKDEDIKIYSKEELASDGGSSNKDKEEEL